MSGSKLEFHEVVGKQVVEFFVVEDPEFGQEALVRFSDGTQLSIAIGFVKCGEKAFRTALMDAETPIVC